jgi:hypothetical protein
MAPKPTSSGKLLCACRRHQCRQFIEAETSASRRFWGSSRPSNALDRSLTLDFVGITVHPKCPIADIVEVPRNEKIQCRHKRHCSSPGAKSQFLVKIAQTAFFD